jgi:hypothetical protein
MTDRSFMDEANRMADEFLQSEIERGERIDEKYRKPRVDDAAAELAVIRKMAEDAITVAHLGDMVAAHFGRTDLT